MTNIIMLIAALKTFNLHGSSQKCEDLLSAMVNVVAKETLFDDEPVHANEDLKAIGKFYENCKKKGKK